MGFTLSGRTIQRVAVVGSGNLGPDVALFFARALHRHAVPVLLHDVSSEALDAGRARVKAKLARGVESGTFRPEELLGIERSLTFTLDKSLLLGCDFILEACTEDLGVKQTVFDELERLVPPHALLASTSSHLEPQRIFERLKRPERALVHHLLYPAERNPVVEIVAGPKTTVAAWCARFYEALGKVPIRVQGRYGYALNPVFEGLFLAAMRIEEKGLSPAVIDAIYCRVMGSTAGPFTVADLAGGNLITKESLGVYHDKIMPWFESPASLELRSPRPMADRGATVSYSNRMFEETSQALLGAYFGLACEVVESGTVPIEDLELGIEMGLALRPPFAMMNELGPRKVRALIEDCARAQPGLKMPRDFGPWTIPVVLREDRDGVAVLTVRRPKTLNALNRDAFRQLDVHLTAIQSDSTVRGVVITGFGTKAFVSGADIHLLHSLPGPDEARALSSESNRLFRRIETLGKPVVAALNGLSLGGGSELAYACAARVARKGLPLLFGQPEVKLGIIPGAGGTQRLPRLIDFSTAWRLLRTGGSLSGAEALQLGLILEEVDGDVVARAMELALQIRPAPLPEAKIPAVLPEVDLKGLSRRTDEILRRAILDGAKLPVDAALKLETHCFAEVFGTRDRQIGLANFLKTNLKQPAVFEHA